MWSFLVFLSFLGTDSTVTKELSPPSSFNGWRGGRLGSMTHSAPRASGYGGRRGVGVWRGGGGVDA